MKQRQKILVVPEESRLGPFQLGMSRRQVEEIVRSLCQANGQNPTSDYQNEDGSRTCYYRLWPSDLWYSITYQGDVAADLLINCSALNQAVVLAKGANLFEEKVPVVMEKLKEYSEFLCDGPDPVHSFRVLFPQANLCLWRDGWYAPDVEQQEGFLSLSEEVKEDERKLQYFEVCALLSPQGTQEQIRFLTEFPTSGRR